MELMERQKVDC